VRAQRAESEVTGNGNATVVRSVTAIVCARVTVREVLTRVNHITKITATYGRHNSKIHARQKRTVHVVREGAASGNVRAT